MNAVLHLDKVRPKKGECSDYGNEVLLDPTTGLKRDMYVVDHKNTCSCRAPEEKRVSLRHAPSGQNPMVGLPGGKLSTNAMWIFVNLCESL